MYAVEGPQRLNSQNPQNVISIHVWVGGVTKCKHHENVPRNKVPLFAVNNEIKDDNTEGMAKEGDVIFAIRGSKETTNNYYNDESFLLSGTAVFSGIYLEKVEILKYARLIAEVCAQNILEPLGIINPPTAGNPTNIKLPTVYDDLPGIFSSLLSLSRNFHVWKDVVKYRGVARIDRYPYGPSGTSQPNQTTVILYGFITVVNNGSSDIVHGDTVYMYVPDSNTPVYGQDNRTNTGKQDYMRNRPWKVPHKFLREKMAKALCEITRGEFDQTTQKGRENMRKVEDSYWELDDVVERLFGNTRLGTSLSEKASLNDGKGKPGQCRFNMFVGNKM